ncbi:MAG: WD40 repeat domain-containing protein, partial [Saprospiraceae bacterium]
NATWLRMQDSTVVIISDQEPLGQVLPQRLSDGHFSPAGNFFVAELPDKSVALFTKAGKPVSLPELASGIDLSPNDRFLLLNYKSGKSELRTKDSRVWKTLLTNMTGLFSPDNRYVLLFNGPNSNLELLDLQTATSLAFPSKGNILSVAFSSDDQYVALAFDSKVVELRRTDGKLVATIPEIGSVRFSPQGHYLLIRKNNDARIFSMDGVQMVAFDRQGSISNFEFSSDDQWLVISGFEGDVKTLPLPVGLHQYLKF